MSTVLFWAVIFPIAYVLLGIGTARAIMPIAVRAEQKRYSSIPVRVNEDAVVLPAMFGGFFWPLALVYLLVLRPVGTVVAPLFIKWLTAPARRAGAR